MPRSRSGLLDVSIAATCRGGALQVQVTTTPPGAAVRITGGQAGANETQCTTACQVSLAPGAYSVTAFLDGYEPAASGIAVTPGQPASVTLALEPQAQSLRILTERIVPVALLGPVVDAARARVAKATGKDIGAMLGFDPLALVVFLVGMVALALTILYWSPWFRRRIKRPIG